MSVRAATENDLPAIVAIKQRLAFQGVNRGGFLLGSSEAGYRERLSAGRIWLLERARVLGFAVTLYPAELKASPLWELAKHIQWQRQLDAPTLEEVGYFDQLAMLPGCGSRAGLELAAFAFWDLATHSRYVVTTTVRSPVTNLAAVPLIERVGGERVGQLAESYPEIGALVSDIWLIPSARACATLSHGTRAAERWFRTTLPLGNQGTNARA